MPSRAVGPVGPFFSLSYSMSAGQADVSQVSRTGGGPDGMVLGRGVFLSLMQCPPDRGIDIAGPASRCFFLSFSYVSGLMNARSALHRPAPPVRTVSRKITLQFSYSTAVGNVNVAYKREAFMKV